MTVYQYSYSTDLAERWEYDSNGRLLYHGEASAGSSESANVWRIRKFSYTGSNFTADKTEWADGTAGFDKAWDKRKDGTYTYS